MPKRSKKIKRNQRKSNKTSSPEVDELSNNIEHQMKIVDVEPTAESEVRQIEMSYFVISLKIFIHTVFIQIEVDLK